MQVAECMWLEEEGAIPKIYSYKYTAAQYCIDGPVAAPDAPWPCELPS
jgi:hypothetical protein